MAKTETQFKERSPENTILRENLLKKGIDRILDEFTDGKKVLDAGCGDGILLNLLGKMIQANVQWDGVDISDQLLNVTRRKIAQNKLKVNLFLGSITQLPFQDQAYDILFCTMMFHHLEKNDKLCALKEMTRVLKKGGKLIFIDIHPPVTFMEKILALPFFIFLRLTHPKTLDYINRIAKLLEAEGYQINDECYIEPNVKMIVAQKNISI